MAAFFNNIVLELPDITKIEFKKIDRKYFKVILVVYFLFFISLFIGLVLLHQFLFLEELKAYTVLLYTFFIIIFGFIFLYLKLGFPMKKYALRERDISYKSGLLIKKITTVPFSRIQHVEIDEKPISRLFGLASLSVYTAGDSSDDLVVKGLKKEVAIQLKEFIITKIDE
ncbi:MAG: PH domain-containing protein [Polaribacter sp.]|nr:PH domain-containing protein [Polaribacter sp.]MBT4412913.1 PH domain-containing protein [Polaribacter sp.]